MLMWIRFGSLINVALYILFTIYFAFKNIYNRFPKISIYKNSTYLKNWQELVEDVIRNKCVFIGMDVIIFIFKFIMLFQSWKINHEEGLYIYIGKMVKLPPRPHHNISIVLSIPLQWKNCIMGTDVSKMATMYWVWVGISGNFKRII